MKTLEEMNNWSYKEAFYFFNNNAVQQFIPESREYVMSLRPCVTMDLREGNKYSLDTKKSCDIILGAITSQTLILVDGNSASGKSTFSKRLAKKLDAEVLDIDLMCKDFIEESIANCKNEFERMVVLMKMEQATDELIYNELEKRIAEMSKLNKPVILVGMYLEAIYRSVVVKTLGRYFQNVVSIFCLEKSFKIVEKMIKSRREEFKEQIRGERKRVLEEYERASFLANEADGIWLSLGMRYSFIIDISISDMFI